MCRDEGKRGSGSNRAPDFGAGGELGCHRFRAATVLVVSQTGGNEQQPRTRFGVDATRGGELAREEQRTGGIVERGQTHRLVGSEEDPVLARVLSCVNKELVSRLEARRREEVGTVSGKPARAGGLRCEKADDGACPCGRPAFEQHRRNAYRKLARVLARRPVDDPVHRPRKALGKHGNIDGNSIEGVLPSADTEERIVLLYQGNRLVRMKRAHKRNELGEASLPHRQHEKRREQNACGRLFGGHARDEAASIVRAPRGTSHVGSPSPAQNASSHRQ